MKVWIVAVYYDYEGYDEPMGVYSNEEDAIKEANEYNSDDRPIGNARIFEIEVK